MENKSFEIPYIAHESTVDRLERVTKRLWVLCIIMFLSFVLSNAAWLWYESQFENLSEQTTVTQDVKSEGEAIVSGLGDVINGD